MTDATSPIGEREEAHPRGGIEPSVGVLERMRDNGAVVRRFLTEGVTGAERDYAGYLTDDHVQHGPALHQTVRGPVESYRYFARLARAFPDLAVSVTSTLSRGDRVVAHGTMRGRHAGDLVFANATFRPTGRDAEWAFSATCELDDGVITETRLWLDTASLMNQLDISF